MRYLFTSDIHFSDERIMRLCNRPFHSVKEMDEYIINTWNNKVSIDDNVWILGDIVSPEHYDSKILNRLNGNINLIIGNHDYEIMDKIVNETKITIFNNPFYFDSAYNQKQFEEYNIVMSHYPIMDWNGIKSGSIHLYGHVHNKHIKEIDNYYRNKLAFNVCMDVNDFEPKTLYELASKEDKIKLFNDMEKLK